MAIKLSTGDISALYLGSTAVSAAYLGSTSVWSAGGGGASGSLYEWGQDGSDFLTTLSDGTTASSSTPILVDSGTYTAVSMSERSAGSTLGPHALAIAADGTLWATGRNNVGQLGDNSTTDSATWKQIGTDTWTAISASDFSSRGINSAGNLFAWGDNTTDGSFGNGSTVDYLVPTQIGVDAWISVATGSAFTIGIKSDGTLWAAGANWTGQLGDGTSTRQRTFVQVGSSSDWVTVEASTLSSFAINSSGHLYGWGYNAQGQLGLGNTTAQTTPQRIGSESWESVSTAEGDAGHTLAIRADGTLWGWGHNTYGQVGDGTTTRRLSPVQIGSATWSAAAALPWGGLGIQTDGTLWSWGTNGSGQIGDGTTTQRNSPVQIGSGLTVVALTGTDKRRLIIAS